MKHLKFYIILIIALSGIKALAQNETNRLEQDKASQQENQKEVRNQPEVQVNQEMLDRFAEYQRNGSNIFLNWHLLQGHNYAMIQAIVDDYQTITLQESRASEYMTQK